MTTWSQKVALRFLSTRLSADKFLCTTGRQSRRYVKKHFDQFNGHRLPYFPTQISPLVGTFARSIELPTKSSSAWGWCKLFILHERTYLSYYETAFFLARHIAQWANLQDTCSSKGDICTKFSNTCKQLSIILGNLISLNILPLKLCPPHHNRKKMHLLRTT